MYSHFRDNYLKVMNILSENVLSTTYDVEKFGPVCKGSLYELLYKGKYSVSITNEISMSVSRAFIFICLFFTNMQKNTVSLLVKLVALSQTP